MKRTITAFAGLLLLLTNSLFTYAIDIKGRVVHAASHEAIEFANIVLQTPDSVFVAGVVTNAAGDFTFQKINPGNYRIMISAVGYKTGTIHLQDCNQNVRLDEILLEEDLVTLDEVNVTASATIIHSDRQILFPTDKQRNASTNGVDLLHQLMLPKIQVNPLLGDIKLPGGGEIQYRINGVKSELQDVKALKPLEIIRIEFHDNPGLRYGNAEVVLDYIIHRPQTGGNVGVDLSDAFTTGWGDNLINGKINHKKSEFAVNYSISHRRFHELWRDNEETFTFADGSTFIRKEQGEPGGLKTIWQNLNGTYSYQNERSMFSASVRYYAYNEPYAEAKGTIRNMANYADAVSMIDNASSENQRPALDLYFQHNMRNEQTLVFNLVGTYNYTENTRIYTESRDNHLLTDVNNQVTGNKYSLIGEGIYENKIGTNRLSGGLKHMQSFSDNTYRNMHTVVTEMNQSESSLFGEFNGKIRKLDYTLGVGATRSFFRPKGDEGYEYYTFNPRLTLHYALPGNSFIRLQGKMNNTSPSLSNLSAVEQMIDSLQIQRGNPNLKPYLRHQTELTYELRKGIFYGNLWGAYEYLPNAIMDEKHLEGDKIIQTWNNQKDWQRFSGRLTLRVGQIKDIVTLSVTGGINHYLSNGNTYRHEYTNLFTNIQLNAMYKKFRTGFELYTNYNEFYGETLSGGENVHVLMAGYKHKNMSINAFIINPFVDNYKVDSENWSQYASYRKSYYINESSRLFFLRFTYSFSFGRTFDAAQKRLDNTDNDTGIMSTGK